MKRNFNPLTRISVLPTGPGKIINVLGGRLREAHDRLRGMAGERVEQRIAGILVMLSGKIGPTIPFTRQEIADISGTTTETSIRVISRLKDRGIVSSNRGKITILDQTKLRLLAEGSPLNVIQITDLKSPGILS
ncbi:Crp/Fnr family transcriptional regulator [Dehalococcoidia bacterium]|nr:Crp/Fnr family transcriptional regulator [Dehalococcoidia bacterium]